MMVKKTVIAIVGPTAVGKTALSIEIATSFSGEIISGDSMQVYKHLDIGTSKIKTSEMKGIPHHMIDIKNPDEPFTVAEFKKCVESHIETITLTNQLPILVGGSGLYVQSILYDYQFAGKKRNLTYTKQLEQFLKENGNIALYQKLKNIDPLQASKIHPNNYRRVIRALEIYKETGQKPSEISQNKDMNSPYNVIFIGLEMDRENLYNQINQRVDEMLDEGLLVEVKQLLQQGLENKQAMKAIGYKEFIPYFKGDISKEEAIRILKRNSRRYAKRQYTWFKNKMDITWFKQSANSLEREKITSEIINYVAGKLRK